MLQDAHDGSTQLQPGCGCVLAPTGTIPNTKVVRLQPRCWDRAVLLHVAEQGPWFAKAEDEERFLEDRCTSLQLALHSVFSSCRIALPQVVGHLSSTGRNIDKPDRMKITALVVLAVIGWVNGQQQCYFGPGAENRGTSDLVPCESSGQSACCLLGDTCLSGNTCYNFESGNLYQYGCTDITYQDESCPYKCGWNSSKLLRFRRCSCS